MEKQSRSRKVVTVPLAVWRHSGSAVDEDFVKVCCAGAGLLQGHISLSEYGNDSNECVQTNNIIRFANKEEKGNFAGPYFASSLPNLNLHSVGKLS